MNSLHFPRLFAWLLSAVLLASCSPQRTGASDDLATETSEETIAFLNVNVIPMDREQVLSGQTVLVLNGQITAVGPADQIELPKKATKINAAGKYLLPGLAEMHAHIPVASDAGDDEYVRETLFLWLSNGITTVRGMLGDPYHLRLKEQVARDEVLSPRIYTSSPSFNGNTVRSVEEARSKVQQYHKEGYDFLKIHPGVPLAPFNALAETADELGIRFAGHVPVEVGIRRAIEAGYASVDHIDGYLEGLVRNPDELEPGGMGFFGMNVVDHIDMDLLAPLAKASKERGVWVVPTQSLMLRWPSPDDAQKMAAAAAEMRYMPPATVKNWIQRKTDFQEAPGYSASRFENFIAIRNQILLGLHEAGVDFLLGSDSPQVFNVPGFSIHHEIASLRDAGLSPYEILRSGTANPARYVGAEGEYGTIVPGASADLILLAANPLQDTRNLRQVEGVMVPGKWLPKSVIDAELVRIAAKYAGME